MMWFVAAYQTAEPLSWVGGALLLIGVALTAVLLRIARREPDYSGWKELSAFAEEKRPGLFLLMILSLAAGVLISLIAIFAWVGSPRVGDPCDPNRPAPPGFECR